jgi:UDP-N-acetylmuramoylalanine--D-glutamate ligase
MKLQGKDVLMVGMARSGLAAVEFLSAQGARVRATDSKALPELDAAVAAALDRLQISFTQQKPELFETGDLIVVSPGVPFFDVPGLASSPVPIVSEVQLAAWSLRGKLVGITGSLGKTTTTSLVGHLLKECGVPAQVGGNIGIPPIAMVTSSREEQWNVLELSSFQLATTTDFRAHIGAVLNISENHLDWHKTMVHYVASKAKLLANQTRDDEAVLNLDDPQCAAMSDATPATTRWFSRTQVRDGVIHVLGAPLMDAAHVPLPGQHNLENVMAAASIAILAGAEREAVAKAVTTFAAVEHRLEFVSERQGVKYYNDSKATTPEAALRAIAALDGPLWIILGGKDKGLDFTRMRSAIAARAKAVLLVGQDADKIAAQLAGATEFIRAGTVDAAVREAAARAVPGDIVLLAPACTSWDQFKSYEERGRFFKSAVHALGEGK